MILERIYLKGYNVKRLFYLTLLILIIFFPTQFFSVKAAVVQLRIQAVDVRDSPLSDARVTFFAPPPGAYLIAEASTDSKGVATFTLTDPPNEINVFVSWKDVVVSQSKVSSQAGFSKIVCNVGFVKVRVMGSANRIVSDFKVSLTWNTATGPKSVYNFTDRYGFAVFALMPLQTYVMDVYWYDTSYKVYSETFTPKLETVHEINVPLYELIVETKDTAGKPVSNVEVVLGNSLKTFKSTTVNGISSFKNLLAGVYTLKVYYGGTVYRSMEINLESDKQISIVLPQMKTYTLTVQVVDNIGSPLPNSKVTVFDSENKVRGEQFTNSSGLAKFVLPEGVYRIQVAIGTQTSKVNVQLSDNSFQKIVISSTSNTQTTTGASYVPNIDPIPVTIVLASILLSFIIFFIIVKRISSP
ncbi:MAG: hypothetical protein ACP5K8_03745 [Nitrososphaeria archaeon]